LTTSQKRRPKITLVLGGGGARGIAHLGVIEVLLKAGYEIERIVGVSIGSLVGAMFAFDTNIEHVKQRAIDYLLSPAFQKHQLTLFGTATPKGNSATGGMFAWYERVQSYLQANRLFHRVIGQPALLPGIILRDVVEHLLDDVDISEAKIPLSIVAVDLLSGHKVVLEKGPLRDAVRASSALPGIFPPIPYNNMLLSDIGVIYSLPTNVASAYRPECMIAVDVGTGLQYVEHCNTALDVLVRMDEIGEALFRKYVQDMADVIVRPSVSDVDWFDFSPASKLISEGRKAATRIISQIPQI